MPNRRPTRAAALAAIPCRRRPCHHRRTAGWQRRPQRGDARHVDDMARAAGSSRHRSRDVGHAFALRPTLTGLGPSTGACLTRVVQSFMDGRKRHF